MEVTLTFEQVESHLHKWAQILSSYTDGRFEIWELINSAWADGKVRLLPQSKIKYASHRIRWDMIDYIRRKTESRRQQNWSRAGRKWPKSYHFSALESNEQRRTAFIETFPAISEDLERKDTINYLVNHPSLSGCERLLMKLLFIDGYTQTETARILGYHESWVSLHKKSIIKRLKALTMSEIA